MTDSSTGWGWRAGIGKSFLHVAVIAGLFLLGTAAKAQTASGQGSDSQTETKTTAPSASLSVFAPAQAQKSAPSGTPWFFPKDWVRGYLDFAVAPPHNEPDLGRCNSQGPPCTAFARYVLSGYIEVQPFGRGPLKHLYAFAEPRAWFGKNIPQTLYTWSWQPLALERVIGLGYELPKNFELRLTNHAVSAFGQFNHSLGPTDAGPGSPLGLYTTASVRWYFGGYGRRTHSW